MRSTSYRKRLRLGRSLLFNPLPIQNTNQKCRGHRADRDGPRRVPQAQQEDKVRPHRDSVTSRRWAPKREHAVRRGQEHLGIAPLQTTAQPSPGQHNVCGHVVQDCMDEAAGRQVLSLIGATAGALLERCQRPGWSLRGRPQSSRFTARIMASCGLEQSLSECSAPPYLSHLSCPEIRDIPRQLSPGVHGGA